MSSASAPHGTEKSVTPDQEGLQVVNHGNDAPQVIDGFKMKPYEAGGETSAAVAPEKRILGLRRTTFILAVVLALVIVAAAVGGGVGGSKAVSSAYE